MRIHSDSMSEMPDAATGTVGIDGLDIQRSFDVSRDYSPVRFDALPSGIYDLSITVDSTGVEVGSYQFPIEVGDTLRDVTARIEYRRGNLAVEPVVATVLDREYSGGASITPDGCIGDHPGGTGSSELHIAAAGDDIELTLDTFDGDTLRMTGQFTPFSETTFAAGTFESSDSTSGTWEIIQMVQTTPGGLASLMRFDNQTRSCQATVQYAGLTDDGSGAPEGYESSEALAVVEVTGHGRTQTVALERGDALANFNDLLIGPYEVAINVERGGRAAEQHGESVVVGAEGARVTAEFIADRALMAAGPLRSREDYSFLNHEFTGKSIVSAGSADCIGGVALLDSTTLAMTADGEAVSLDFDNFFGAVLRLSGNIDDSADTLTGSGAYESSNSGGGSWAIGYFATPTPLSIATAVEFHNETEDCRATYEFSGVR